MAETDLISRQAAIYIIRQLYPGIPRVPWMRKEWRKRYEPYIRAEDAIRELPSAQPDLDEWCTDCKEYDSERHCCPRWNRVIRQALKDAQLAITDEQAIEHLQASGWMQNHDKQMYEMGLKEQLVEGR